ncbi:hypothetical protein FGB62_335g05 [Gracilaria domingensis]|nr:hypothetical protein FGB62_335g05 [Gracilaria domingensis]
MAIAPHGKVALAEHAAVVVEHLCKEVIVVTENKIWGAIAVKIDDSGAAVLFSRIVGGQAGGGGYLVEVGGDGRTIEVITWKGFWDAEHGAAWHWGTKASDKKEAGSGRAAV